MSGTSPSFATSDGVRLVFDDKGSGRPVILVHGYSGHRGNWSLQQPALLDAGYRVIAVDQRNHGDSDKPDFGQRMSRHGKDLRELMDHLGLERATVVGHSMGVSVTLAMFSLFGTSGVSQFVAIDQSPCITNRDGWTWGVRKITWDNVWQAAGFEFVWGTPEVEPPVPPPVPNEARAYSFETFPHERVRELLLDHFVADWRDVLPRIDVPTWVVTGRFSPFYDLAGMEWFTGTVQKGMLSVFSESGHSPHVNEAEEFNRQFLEFLAH